MAHMIPLVPKEFDPKSDEGVVFNALKKLPDDYYVFHSVSATVVENGVLYERELDFVVANSKKGILCIEAKNGSNINYDGTMRAWKYSSGRIMDHDGPYNQIATAKRAIIAKIKSHPNEEVQKLFKKCKVMHAVFFFKVSQIDFDEIANNGLPENADSQFTMVAEDLINPTKKIAEIFSLKLPSQIRNTVEETKLTEEEFQLLIDSVLCPTFNLVPSPSAKSIVMEEQMNQLLYEQYRLLDFLEDQETAVINGAAGTGKTMIAAYKAKLHSIEGEKVLFLCYNRLLCDNLIKIYKSNPIKSRRDEYKNVDFMTISQLTQKATGNYKDYDGLMEWLYDCVDDPEKFGYKHIIVDEGQDFGLIDILVGISASDAEKNCSIIDTLQEVVLSNSGTFYLFYDKYQMIQGSTNVYYRLPDCILNSDCRLTLKKNCRNTKEIARTSVTPLKDQKNKAIKPIVASVWYEPIKPVLHIAKDEDESIQKVHTILDKYKENQVEDIVILTPGKIEFCCLADNIKQGEGENSGYYLYEYNGSEYKITTCRKFKGLESEAVIMVDLNKESFTGKNGMEFYVGSSRAKQRLDIVCNLDENDYSELIRKLDVNAPTGGTTEKLRRTLGAVFATEIAD